MSWAEPWQDARVAAEQRALVDGELQARPWPAVIQALIEAVRSTQCPGSILDIGCASGYGREILDRAGVSYRSYEGRDISLPALAIAKERYPESTWAEMGPLPRRGADIVTDGACLMHVEDWRAHLEALCAASRRWVILHRLPIGPATERHETRGYGRTFPAWRFGPELGDRMRSLGFRPAGTYRVDQRTVTVCFARPRHYACYFDAGFIPRARAMWASLERHGGPAVMHALCWDNEALQAAKEMGMDAVHIDALIERYPELRSQNLPGPARTRVEHMWTVGPQYLADVMARTGEPLTYVDADVYFFASPEPIFAELDGGCGVIPHGFARASQRLPGPTLESHRAFGLYNVGIVHFSHRETAERWAELCREWCYDRVDGDRYGDQRYLERLAAHVVAHPGACLGPWAIHTRALDVRAGVIHVGGRPLIAYHFSALKPPHLTRPEYQLTERQAEIIYRPYLEVLRAG